MTTPDSTRCIAVDPDCADCRRERLPHEGDCGDLCGTFARLLKSSEGHAAIHHAGRDLHHVGGAA